MTDPILPPHGTATKASGMMAGMEMLQEMFRYNRWATARVFKVCLAADPALVDEEAPGTVGTVRDSLAHLVGTEEGFSAVIEGIDGPPRPRESGKDAFEHLVGERGLSGGYVESRLDWLADRADHLAEHWNVILENPPDGFLAREIQVPWLDFSMTVQQALMQVLVHAGHHRSQVFSALGDRGVKVPDLDYIVMIKKEKLSAQPG